MLGCRCGVSQQSTVRRALFSSVNGSERSGLFALAPTRAGGTSCLWRHTQLLERACTLCESGVIGVEDLQLPSAPTSPAFGELQEWLDHLERDRILAAIAQTGGNKTKAARVLGISFRALRYRLSRLGIGME